MFPARSLCRSTRFSAVAEPLHTEAIAHASGAPAEAIEPAKDNPYQVPQIALPNEIWGEVAGYSSRTDILNLRTTCHMLKAEADTVITTLTLRGNDRLSTFIKTRGFEAVKVLRLEGIHSTGLQQLASHLAAHPRNDLMIDIADSCYGGLEHAVTSLSALQSLSVQACEQFTSRGVESIAHIGTLRALSIEEAFYPAAPIDATAAAALAANPCLESLDFHTSAQPFSEDSLFALSHSQSLRHIAVAIGPGLHHLANIASLEDIKLSGRCTERHAIDDRSARCLANMPNLHAISIAGAWFEGGGLSLMLGDSLAKKLHLADMHITTNAVQALLSNVNLLGLTLEHAGLTSEDKAALSHHPTLEHLSIDYAPHSSHERPIR